MIIVWADNSLWWNWLSRGKKKAWFVVFANVYGTNTSIMDTVKMPQEVTECLAGKKCEELAMGSSQSQFQDMSDWVITPSKNLRQILQSLSECKSWLVFWY